MLKDFGDFQWLPVRMPNAHGSTHSIYIKRNDTRGKDESMPDDRTLFLLNLPSHTPVSDLFPTLQALFKSRHLESVILRQHGLALTLTPDQLPPTTHASKWIGTGAFVYAVFASADAMTQSLHRLQRKPSTAYPLTQSPCLDRFRLRHRARVAATQTYQLEIDGFMQTYDSAQVAQLHAKQAQHGIPDHEGWITVTRGANRRNTTRGGDVTVKAVKPADLKNLQNKTAAKGVVDFYRFQQRQAKRDRLAELRAKFETDKLRIAELKATRRFKPY